MPNVEELIPVRVLFKGPAHTAHVPVPADRAGAGGAACERNPPRQLDGVEDPAILYGFLSHVSRCIQGFSRPGDQSPPGSPCGRSGVFPGVLSLPGVPVTGRRAWRRAPPLKIALPGPLKRPPKPNVGYHLLTDISRCFQGFSFSRAPVMTVGGGRLDTLAAGFTHKTIFRLRLSIFTNVEIFAQLTQVEPSYARRPNGK
jgi:hypothetical protein